MKQDYRALNHSLNLIRTSNRSGSHVNCIRLGRNNGDLHSLGIVFRCLHHLRTGTPFITEAIFYDGSRSDIFLPTMGKIEEILVTEKHARLEKKSYPFKITPIRITEEWLIKEFTEMLINHRQKKELQSVDKERKYIKDILDCKLTELNINK